MPLHSPAIAAPNQAKFASRGTLYTLRFRTGPTISILIETPSISSGTSMLSGNACSKMIFSRYPAPLRVMPMSAIFPIWTTVDQSHRFFACEY